MHQKIGPLNHQKTGPLNQFLDAVFGTQKLVPLSPPNKELQIARAPRGTIVGVPKTASQSCLFGSLFGGFFYHPEWVAAGSSCQAGTDGFVSPYVR